MRLLSSLLLRKIGGGKSVIFNPDDGRTSVVNPVGALICELLQKKDLSCEEIFSALQKQVRGMSEENFSDIQKFLSELQQTGYLAVDHASSDGETDTR